MDVSKAFNDIISHVQSSNLNFILELSPFSAIIHLQKSEISARSKFPPTPLLKINSERSDSLSSKIIGLEIQLEKKAVEINELKVENISLKEHNHPQPPSHLSAQLADQPVEGLPHHLPAQPVYQPGEQLAFNNHHHPDTQPDPQPCAGLFLDTTTHMSQSSLVPTYVKDLTSPNLMTKQMKSFTSSFSNSQQQSLPTKADTPENNSVNNHEDSNDKTKGAEEKEAHEKDLKGENIHLLSDKEFAEYMWMTFCGRPRPAKYSPQQEVDELGDGKNIDHA